MNVGSSKVQFFVEQKYFPPRFIRPHIISRSTHHLPFFDKHSQLHRLDFSKVRLTVGDYLQEEDNCNASGSKPKHPFKELPFHATTQTCPRLSRPSSPLRPRCAGARTLLHLATDREEILTPLLFHCYSSPGLPSLSDEA